MEIGFPLHIALIPVAIAAAILLLGLVLFVKVNKILGLVTGAVGILFGLVFGPMLLMDRVIVDEHRIRQSTGWWFDQTEKGFDFDGLEQVIITTGRDMKGREIEIWVARYTRRPEVRIDPGDLWELNGDAISEHLNALGIEVVRSPE